jgi:hypothetical protein
MNEQVNAEIQDKIEVDAVELKTIEMRVNGIKDATHRSRFVFIIMTIAAATILICQWNALVSWDRGMAFEEKSDNVKISENQKTATDEWIRSMTINVGLLGIRVSTTDLAVIGSISLIIIMVWFFFSQRRENRAIVSLLRYCYRGFIEKKLSKDVCNLVYEGVVQSIVFIDMGGGDKPIEGIVATDDPPKSTFFIRRILTWLTYLAPFTIFIIVVADIVSLFMPSHLRDTEEVLWKILFDGNHPISVGKIILFDLFAILACIYTGFLCKNIRGFSRATSRTIKDYKTAVLAIQALRNIHAAQMTYQATVGGGNFGSLTALYQAGLISEELAGGHYGGYVFDCSTTAPTSTAPARFNSGATPFGYRVIGIRSFYIDETGICAAPTKPVTPLVENAAEE